MKGAMKSLKQNVSTTGNISTSVNVHELLIRASSRSFFQKKAGGMLIRDQRVSS